MTEKTGTLILGWVTNLGCLITQVRFAAVLFVVWVAANVTWTNVVSGQNFGQLFSFGKRAPELPVVFDQTPSQKQIFDLFESRLSVLKQLDSNVSISMPGMPKIKGVLQIELPSRMRLKAGIMGVSELGVDVGANEKNFWIWTKASLPGQPPAFYFADQQLFRQSHLFQSIPLDPNWLVDATGLVRFDPTDTHWGPQVSEHGLVMISAKDTPSGRLFKRTLIHPQTGLVIQQAIYNSQNQRLAYTNSTDYRPYDLPGGQGKIGLPHLVQLHMTGPDGKDEMMVVNASKYSLNSLYGDPRKMWSMPQPTNVQKLDLTAAVRPNLQVTGPANVPPFDSSGTVRYSRPGSNPYPAQPANSYSTNPVQILPPRRSGQVPSPTPNRQSYSPSSYRQK
ncbi:MAG: hypothetical protein AAF939_02935 [Planctomycetota bacterium]